MIRAVLTITAILYCSFYAAKTLDFALSEIVKYQIEQEDIG